MRSLRDRHWKAEQRYLIAICAAVFALVGSAAADPLKGDGAGCKDKALGVELASLKDTNAR